jgi:hypothetical protein
MCKVKLKFLHVIIYSVEMFLSKLWEDLFLTNNQNKSIFRSWRIISYGMLTAEMFLQSKPYLVRSHNINLEIEYLFGDESIEAVFFKSL